VGSVRITPLSADGLPAGRRWLLLGTTGSAVLALAGVVAGAWPVRDPFDGIPGVHGWREQPFPAVVAAYLGLAVLVVAWLRLGQDVRRQRVPLPELRRILMCWTAPLLLIPPLYSRDVYSYLAQGVMFGSRLDPYRFGPASLGGELAAGVTPVWANSPAPYGPVFLTTASGVMKVARGQVIPGLLLMRLVCVASVAVAAYCLPKLARRYGVQPTRALWLGILNPLVLVHLVAGMHNDALMLALLLAGLLAGLVAPTTARAVAAGVLIGLAGLVKVPALLALPFLARAARRPLPAMATIVAAAVTTAAVTAATGTWYGWVGAIGETARVHNGLSLTTDLGDLLAILNRFLGGRLPFDPVLVTRSIGALTGGTLLVFLLVRLRDRPVLAVGLGLTGVVLLGPVVHPWYLLWGLLPLAAGAGDRRVVRGATLLSVVMAFYPVPSGGGPTSQTSVGLLAVGAALPLLWAVTSRRPAVAAALPAMPPDREPVATGVP
jgi:Glycosyltransferase family 87